MSRILSLPITYIVCRGETPYDPIGGQGSLHNVEVKPKVQSESINVNLSNLTFESVAIEDGTDLGEHTLQWIADSKAVQPWADVQDRTLTCDDNIKSTYIDELRFLISKGYNISGVHAPRTVTYDLNNNWGKSTYSHPKDAADMAMFQSESNYHVSGTTSTMYIKYSASSAPDNVAVFICSNSEPTYDCTKIYALDSESEVVADTARRQGIPDGLLSTNYVQQNYTIPGDNQTHFIRIDYYKDYSADQGEDRGFVCVAPIDGQVINPYVPLVPVASIDIHDVVYTGGGTYEFDIEISPANADPTELVYDNWYTCDFISGRCDIETVWTDTGFGTKRTKGHAYFTGLVSNSGQFCLVIKSDVNPEIFDEEVVTVGEV